MSKVRAWEILCDPTTARELNVVGMSELMAQAGYEPEVIQKAINERGNARLDAGMVM